MKHNPNERWSIKKILKVFCESIDYLPLTVSQAIAMDYLPLTVSQAIAIDYLPLTVSQAIAMEINDKNIVQGCLKCCTEWWLMLARLFIYLLALFNVDYKTLAAIH